MTGNSIDIVAATADRWADFEALMGPRGGCGGCWCMYWRRQHKAYEAGKGAGNRSAIRKVFRNGPPPGLLAYDGDRPVGWCSVAPRAAFPRLERSRVLKPLDDEAVWSVSCFLIQRAYRNSGLSVALLRAAADFVHGQGGRLLEGYPIDPRPEQRPYPAAYAWTGFAPAFLAAGFREVARRSPSRPIMRKRLG